MRVDCPLCSLIRKAPFASASSIEISIASIYGVDGRLLRLDTRRWLCRAFPLDIIKPFSISLETEISRIVRFLAIADTQGVRIKIESIVVETWINFRRNASENSIISSKKKLERKFFRIEFNENIRGDS